MIVKDLYVSLARFCDGFRQEMTSISPGLTVVNFDAHGEHNPLPENDVVGWAQMALETGVTTTMMVLIGISTHQDHNLFRHADLISALYEKFLPGTRQKVYNAETGFSKGFMISTEGLRLMPMAESNARPLQFVAIQFETDSFKTP